MNSKKSILAMGLMATILGGGVSSATEERAQMGETRKLWEEDTPVAKSLTEIRALAEHADQLKGKVVTIEGVEIDSRLKGDFSKIIYPRRDLCLHFHNCQIDFRAYPIFACFEGGALSITNCNISPRLARCVLECLSVYDPTDVDFSNNNLGGQEGKRELLDSVIHAVTHGVATFSTLNLSRNGFDEGDIAYVSDSLKAEPNGCVQFRSEVKS